MRRRRPQGHRTLTAEQLVAEAARIEARVDSEGGSQEVRSHAFRAALAEIGYDAVDWLRARYWLRRGKPAGYVWDDHATRGADPLPEDPDHLSYETETTHEA